MSRYVRTAKLHGKKFNETMLNNALEKLCSLCLQAHAEPARRYEFKSAIDDTCRRVAIALLNIEGAEGGGTQILLQIRQPAGDSLL
jgi:hypothetical protein